MGKRYINNSRVNTILRTEDILENNDIVESKVKDVFTTSDGRVYEVLISYKLKEKEE
jgi:hypothetical protein